MNQETEHKTSLRRRYMLAVCVMLLPLIGLLLAAAYTQVRAIDSMEERIHQPAQGLTTLDDLKKRLAQAWGAVNRPPPHGEGQLHDLNRISLEIDLVFQKLDRLSSLDPRHRELIATAAREWRQGRALLRQTAGGAEDLPRQAFGNRLTRANSYLDEVSAGLVGEIRLEHATALDIKWKSLVILGATFLAGLLVALIGAYLLFRSIVGPIQRLERSINRFGQGDLNSRVEIKSNDEIGHLATAFNAMAERFQQVQKELDYLSVHDSLTGLYDRSRFHELVSLELQRAKRYERAFSILFLDIEDFHQVNRDFGNLVGDSVLCTVSMQITGSIRPTDAAARFDADQFAVILSETDAEGAAETASRIRRAISDNPINIGDGKRLTIEANIGIATYPNDEETETALFALAEHSLLESKRSRQHQKESRQA